MPRPFAPVVPTRTGQLKRRGDLVEEGSQLLDLHTPEAAIPHHTNASRDAFLGAGQLDEVVSGGLGRTVVSDLPESALLQRVKQLAKGRRERWRRTHTSSVTKVVLSMRSGTFASARSESAQDG